ncbi:SIS domain-containing protein [Thermodesulfobacteriota bacterium]
MTRSVKGSSDRSSSATKKEHLKVIKQARRVLTIEAASIRGLIGKIDSSFAEVVEAVFRCRGKVVLTGIGKSGIICQKIAATFASTGTPAYFLHPAEGIHGELGILTRHDVVIAISYRGETEEVNRIIPVIKRMGVGMIVMTGSLKSTLARAGDIVLDVSVKEEACPLGLAPTASTTAALAMGDALAVALLEKRGFGEEDFALIHPGGSLGRKLLMRVEDLVHSGDEIPMVKSGALMKDALFQITSKGLGITGVMGARGRLAGAITDGDLRRGLEKCPDILTRKVDEFMTPNPKRIEGSALATIALQRMEEHSITSLFVIQKPASIKITGIIHIHDILKAGVA